MIKYYLFLPVLLFSSGFFAQEEDESCADPSKKILKLIETAKNADAQMAVTGFNAAIEADPDNAKAYYEFGMYAYNRALTFYEANVPNKAAGDKSLEKAEEMFRLALEFCPDYHAHCFYYLGVINYNQGQTDEAISFFKDFLAFKHSNAERYAEDHDKKMADVKAVLAEMEEQTAMLKNQVPYNPVKVQNVCTTDGEYFPMISPDNELMFYTRKLDRRNLDDMLSNVVEEFTFSQRKDVATPFDKGNPFKKPFNDGSFTSYGAATMSVDNKEMIFCGCKKESVDGRDYMNCDLYITEFKRKGEGGNDFEWTVPQNMGPDINTNNGWEAQPSLSADGNTLYYTALRPSTRKDDIFVATRNAAGEWSSGTPLDILNTDEKDKSPFLHQDSETLYFVSTVTDERKGVGGLDIFLSRWENGNWSKPVNIGYPINSVDDEVGIFVSTDGKLAYFSSFYGGDWNIYQFELYPEARPKSVAMIKGDLTDEKGEPIKEATIEIAYSGTGEVEKVKVKGEDGKYAAIVKTSTPQDVMVTVQKEGHAFESKLIAKEEVKEKTFVKGTDLAVRALKEGGAYTINDILYETNSYALNKKSEFILKQFARFLKENPTIEIMIQGHTDDVGDDARNLKLSEDRAKEVKRYLTTLGISESRLSSKGYGETKPKKPNTDAESRAVNRRTDFMIQKL